jgi:ketosteroid isomerase-like protein
MSAEDLAVATEFFEALAAGARTGDLEPLYRFLAPDVHWMTPQRDARGVGNVREILAWYSPREQMELDFEVENVVDLGGGRIVSDFQEIYRMKQTGEFAYARTRQIELTIDDGKIATYEMRFAG